MLIFGKFLVMMSIATATEIAVAMTTVKVMDDLLETGTTEVFGTMPDIYTYANECVYGIYEWWHTPQLPHIDMSNIDAEVKELCGK